MLCAHVCMGVQAQQLQLESPCVCGASDWSKYGYASERVIINKDQPG